MRVGIARRAGEEVVEILLPRCDLHSELRWTHVCVECRHLAARVAINGDKLAPGHRTGCVSARELPNVIAAVTATAHDDDGTEAEWLADDARVAVRCGCAVRHRHEQFHP